MLLPGKIEGFKWVFAIKAYVCIMPPNNFQRPVQWISKKKCSREAKGRKREIERDREIWLKKNY